MHHSPCSACKCSLALKASQCPKYTVNDFVGGSVMVRTGHLFDSRPGAGGRDTGREKGTGGWSAGVHTADIGMHLSDVPNLQNSFNHLEYFSSSL